MAEIFTGTIKLPTITGLVAVAMAHRCDHDLTEVVWRKSHKQHLRGEVVTLLGTEQRCCLRCFLKEWAPTTKRVLAGSCGALSGGPYKPNVSIGVWDEVEVDPMESLMYHIDQSMVVVVSIALYPDGVSCRRCRKIP